MPPRKTKVVEEDDQCPTLKLIIVKGPLSGQTFDFKPGSRISIGRVVRGNAISIKDAGVSSKHLLIQVEDTSGSGNRGWTITDLASSNGTFLNGEALEPSAVLSDGDIVKIGEQTSIRVEFEDNVVENVVSCRNKRRNARRGVRDQAADLGVINKSSELGLGFKDDDKKGEEMAGIEVKQEKNVGTRITRNSKKNDAVLKHLNLYENKGLELNEAKELPEVSTIRTRNSRKEEDASETGIDSIVNEGKRKEKGGRGRRRLPMKTISEEAEKDQKESRRSEDGIKKSVGRINSLKEGVDDGLGSTSGIKGKMVADLENMTLGQWFDFLEVYLPQQIIDETETMIGEMRRKAEKFHEFMLEQKKAKRKSKV